MQRRLLARGRSWRQCHGQPGPISGMRIGSKGMPVAQQWTGASRPGGVVLVADDEGEEKHGGSTSITRKTQSKLRQLRWSVTVRLRPEADPLAEGRERPLLGRSGLTPSKASVSAHCSCAADCQSITPNVCFLLRRPRTPAPLPPFKAALVHRQGPCARGKVGNLDCRDDAQPYSHPDLREKSRSPITLNVGRTMRPGELIFLSVPGIPTIREFEGRNVRRISQIKKAVDTDDVHNASRQITKLRGFLPSSHTQTKGGEKRDQNQFRGCMDICA